METFAEDASREEGLRLLKAGQAAEAAAVLSKVVDADPDDAQAHMYLGVAYHHKGDRLHAIHHLEESIRLEETPKAYYNLALVYEASHRTDEAIRQYRMALEMDPNYANAQAALQKLQDQFKVDHPEPVVEVAEATITDGETGVAVAAPTKPSGPPDFAELQAKKEAEILEQHRVMRKSGMIYGLVCGPFFAAFASIAGTYFGFVPASVWSALGMVIMTACGLAYGGAIGFWVGNTCGGEGAGMQAGAVLGAVVGLAMGLIGGAGIFALVTMLVFAVLSGLLGMFLGRIIDASIGQI